MNPKTFFKNLKLLEPFLLGGTQNYKAKRSVMAPKTFPYRHVCEPEGLRTFSAHIFLPLADRRAKRIF